MKLQDLKNKKIAILGLGIENQALVNFLLKKKTICEITICDKRSKEELGDKYKEFVETRHGASVQWKLGEDFNKDLYEFDILFRSPGWPILCPGIQEAVNKFPLPPFNKGGIIVSSPMKLFFDLCPTNNIIGVTGTKGKGTTSSLIYHILKTAKKRVWLGGNIGVAPFSFIDKIKKNDWVVLELSSFQLEDMKVSPKISVMTNFSPEHLAPADPNNPNYHRNLKSYWEAKMNIFINQKRGYLATANKKLKSKIKKLKSKIIYFDKYNLKSNLVGEHNKENIAAAILAVGPAKIKIEIIKKAIESFKGLEHRIEFVKEIDGVKYYNDTFATTPEAAITALKSFLSPIVLLAGGADKGSDFKKLALEIKKRVKFLILLDGVATPKIKKELLKIKFSAKNIKLVYNIKEAVRVAKKNADTGDIILLSPACASFGMFKNYKERGKLFKKEIK
jgi:UDP-N-acetylmuramoylalanine--D-glutamate ligase